MLTVRCLFMTLYLTSFHRVKQAFVAQSEKGNSDIDFYVISFFYWAICLEFFKVILFVLNPCHAVTGKRRGH
jgi:hypothetical protein